MKFLLERDGFCMLPSSICSEQIESLKQVCTDAFDNSEFDVLARSSRGHVYAARNLIRAVPEIHKTWQVEHVQRFLTEILGSEFGLVRALFFDKPPDRTWGLPWHKDTSIAVRKHISGSTFFSRPTVKAGVPHVIACDEILSNMLTLRIHLDEVTDENGPLRVLPGSHVSSESVGQGTHAEVVIRAAEGEILAMRPLITHSSGASSMGTKRHRRILHLEFAATRHLPDGYEWHDYVYGGSYTTA